MKNLCLLSVFMFVLCSCSKDDMTSPGSPGGNQAIEAPHFYGMAMLDTPAPQTRGVANKLKIWPKTMAEEDLTVKFLNGSPGFQKFVRDIAVEWQNAAGVRFIFVGDDQEAIIRIGFDCVPDMKTSWSFTGTDNLQLLDRQDEPTIHFAQWRRIGDVKKRSDALRAFGQALGLELEFRHPEFHPAWITNADGSVNEEKIKKYWMDELAEFISWEELKKMVLDPINVNARFIAKTEGYDQKSVMTWPFYDQIAGNIPVTEFDAHYNTEFSEKDKTFIKELYGESLGEIPDPKRFFPLIEFDYTGTAPSLTVTTTKNLGVIWDADAKEYTPINMPAEQVKFYTASVSHTFAEAKTRRIVIGEILEYGQEWPVESFALTKLDLTGADHATKFDFNLRNKALSYIRVIGGHNFADYVFNFTGYQSLKELYLVGTRNSKVIVDNCRNLEVLATSPHIWKPFVVIRPLEFEEDVAQESLEPHVPQYIGWPKYPENAFSLSDKNGNGVKILGCEALKTISLEHTNIDNIKFGNLPKLEYLYLSSFDEHIVGGGKPYGTLLSNALKTLNSRKGTEGLVVLRGIDKRLNTKPIDAEFELIEDTLQLMPFNKYTKIPIDESLYKNINKSLSLKNWRVVWHSGVNLYSLPIILPPPINPPIEPYNSPVIRPLEE